jgi:lysophospholipase L1-like esterase
MARRPTVRRALTKRLLVALGVSLAVGSCSGAGPTPRSSPIGLTCPVAVEVTSRSQSATGAYSAPSASGGDPPVTVTCAPASGSTFPLGATTVTCTATDTANQTARCTFVVTVVLAPQLRVTNFLAFGDSLTAGAVIVGGQLVVEPSVAYPTDLQRLLGQRYAAQHIVVDDDGLVGETAVQGAMRLPGDLASHRPDVVLLFEGINDLHGSLPDGGIPEALSGIRTMIQETRSAGIQILVGTLTPAEPGALLPETVALIAPFNAQLIPLAQANGATVVDLHAAFLTDVPEWIGPDGLHPTVAGYAEMAQVFFSAIRTSFEGRVAAVSRFRR